MKTDKIKTQTPAPKSIYRGFINSQRSLIDEEKVIKPTYYPRILVIDDNPIYGKIMKKAAAHLGIDVTYIDKAENLDNLGKQWKNFDIAILDVDLGKLNGFDISRCMEHYTSKDIPVILVSQTHQKITQKWPLSIREFVHKDLGPFAIFDAAFEAYEIANVLK